MLLIQTWDQHVKLMSHLRSEVHVWKGLYSAVQSVRWPFPLALCCFLLLELTYCEVTWLGEAIGGFTAHDLTLLTADFVDVLQGQTQGLVGGAAGGHNGVQSLQQGNASSTTLLTLDLPTLEPAHLKWREAGRADTETQKTHRGKADEVKERKEKYSSGGLFDAIIKEMYEIY